MTLFTICVSSRHSFNLICFYKVSVKYCQFLRRVCASNITTKSTCRLACNPCEHSTFSSLKIATSSLVDRHPSLTCGLLVNGVIQCLQSGQPHHLVILNDGEITTLPLEISNGNLHLEMFVISTIYDQSTNDLFKGNIQPFQGIVQSFRRIIKPFWLIVFHNSSYSGN